MSDRDDPGARLTEAGRATPPPLTDDRLAAIERRVVAHVARGTAVAGPVSTRRPRAPYLWVAAAAVLVLAVVAGAVARRPAPDGLRLAAATGVQVIVAGAAPRQAGAGETVVDGATVEVAAGGLVMVGDVRYGPGRYTVTDGRLVAVPAVPATGPGPVAPTLAPDPGPSTAPDRPAATSAATRPPPTTGPAAGPETTRAPVPAPTDPRPVTTATAATTVARSTTLPDPSPVTRPAATTAVPPVTRPAPTTTTVRPTRTTAPATGSTRGTGGP